MSTSSPTQRQQNALPTMLPPLHNAPQPHSMANLRQHAWRLLTDALDSVPGNKALVLDKTLSGPLGAVADVGSLKARGVSRLFHLDENAPAWSSEWKGVVYIVRPTRANASLVSSHVHAFARETAEVVDVVVAVVPRIPESFVRYVEEAGSAAAMRIVPLAMHFVPLDTDVAVLAREHTVRDRLARGDPSSTFDIALALHLLQSQVGHYSAVRGIGAAARRAADVLATLAEEEAVSGSDDKPCPVVDHAALGVVNDGGGGEGGAAGTNSVAPSEQVDVLVLVDRAVDATTPLLTPLTYEGLIGEVLGWNFGVVEVPSADKPDQKSKWPMHSGDVLHEELRDLNFGTVGPIVHNKVLSMQRGYQDVVSKRDGVEMSGVKELARSLARTPPELVSRHVRVCEIIQGVSNESRFRARLDAEQTAVEGVSVDSVLDFVEGIVLRGGKLMAALRLLVVASLTNGGIPRGRWEAMRTLMVHAYGGEGFSALASLQRAGWLRRAGDVAGGMGGGGGVGDASWLKAAGAVEKLGVPAFQLARKVLRLVVGADEEEAAKAYAGYVPTSLRLVELLLDSRFAMAVTSGGIPSQDLRTTFEACRALAGGAPDACAFAMESASGIVSDSPTTAVSANGGFEEEQDEIDKLIDGGLVGDWSSADESSATTTAAAPTLSRRKRVVVAFLGGVALGELNALRAVARSASSSTLSGVDLLVVSDHLLASGDDLLEGFTMV